MTWIRQYAAWLLFIGLVALLIANAWLFLPRFVLNKQKLTKQDLQAQMVQLRQVALDGAGLTHLVADGSAGKTASSQLTIIQRRSDDIVVVLQHTPYEVSLNDSVQNDLALAQVISFTLHDAEFNLQDQLKMSQTSQILTKAATSVDGLLADK